MSDISNDLVKAPSAASALGFAWVPYAVGSMCLLALALAASGPVMGRVTSASFRGWLVIRATALAAIAIMLILLADAATEGDGLTALDQPIWSWLIHHRTGFLTAVLTAVTQIGSTVAMAVLAAATVAVLAFRLRRRGEAVLVTVVALGAGALVSISKPLIGRARPPVEFRLVVETNPSFPSGHAVASVAIVGVLAVVLLQPTAGRRWRRAAAAAAGGFVVLIGFSRIYLAVHWTTDVLGGWLIGGGWLILCLTLYRLWQRREQLRRLGASTPISTP